MNTPLDIKRFQTLAEAYGGDISRWPLADQHSAMLLSGEPTAAAVLRDAQGLDEMLNAWQVAGLPAAFAEQIARKSHQSANAARRLKIWWAGIGLAAALSGAAVGSLGAASLTASPPQAYGWTFFGDVPDQED